MFASGVSSHTLRVCSHSSKKFVTSAVRARGVGEHPPHLPLEDAGFAQFAADRQVEQLVVGDAAPQKERQTRREFDVGETIRRARRDAGRIGFDPEQKIGADQHAARARRECRRRSFHRFGAVLIEAEQRLDVLARCRPAIRAPRQRRDRSSFAQAGSSLALAGWQTNSRRRLGESCGTRPLYGPANQQRRDRHRQRRDVLFTSSRSECGPDRAPPAPRCPP